MSEELSFEATYSKAVENGWDNVKDLARQIWDQSQAAPEAEPAAWMYESSRGVDLVRNRFSDEMRSMCQSGVKETALYAAPQHDAELVEGGLRLEGLTDVSHQLGMLYLHFKNTDQLHVALRELRAKLATLSAKNEGGKV